MLSHLLCQPTHPNASKVVDGESCVASVVQRKQAFEVGALKRIPETGLEFCHAKSFSQILNQNLDKYATTACGFLFVQMDNGQHMPSSRVGREHVAPKSSNVAKSISLEAMDRAEIMLKTCLELGGPKAIELRKSFPHKTDEFSVGFLLTAIFHNHAWKLGFLPWR